MGGRMKQGFLVAALVAAGATFARADEIVLANGHTIKGARAVESKNPNKVVFEVGAGRIELDKKDVTAINPGRTPLHDYEDKAKAIKGSTKVSDYTDLIAWCRQNKITYPIPSLCQEILKIDPNNEIAHKELGHEKLEGKWYTHEQAMEKKGFKLVGDRWMTKAEIELIEQRRLEAQARDMARKAEIEKKKEEERERRRREIEAYNEWYERMTSQLGGYFYQPSEFWTPYFRPFPWRSYLHNNQNYPYGGGGYYGDGQVTL